ncbi:MAG: restriction endonuclease subunit S, partial [Oscillospiraceae bacterium]|nr:restriction endonuclease subunit S [Oscillospiraceae bacterium]
GGFLIAAMKKMIALAGNDGKRKSDIRANQLLGVEIRPDMFTFACSNMMLRGDGKSNLDRADCFDIATIERIKKLKPTISFLNPPYDQGTDVQLEFIEKALEAVEGQNGVVSAIVQMSCAIKDEARTQIVKKRILEKHTLKAVISMPDDLFYPVGVVTCIMVFEANKPNANKKTWFGYLKNDGFVKRKRKGRIDYFSNWKDIKERFLKAYRNNDELIGLSVKKEVGHKDEWCAEPYMETDYSQLSADHFKDSVLKYIAYYVTQEDFSKFSLTQGEKVKNLEVNTSLWKPYKYEDIFIVERGSSTYLQDMNNGPYPYVSASALNNGISAFVDTYNRNGNVIVLNYDGSIGEAFYHDYPFFASEKVVTLKLKNFDLNEYIGLFITTLIKLEKFRYNYGLKWSVNSRMLSSIIKLPAKQDGKPDFEYMEKYIKSLPYSGAI